METTSVIATIIILGLCFAASAIANSSKTLRRMQYTYKWIATLINEGNEPEEPEYVPMEELTDDEEAEFHRNHRRVA